jgi:hypothetical protein
VTKGEKMTQLGTIQDEIIISEAIDRLMKRVKRATGVDMKFGSFNIAIHRGGFNNIEYSLKERCFVLEPKKNRGSK